MSSILNSGYDHFFQVSYSLLLKQLRTACDKESLILTVTVPSNPAVIGKNYPVGKIAESAHYVILSTNEFRKLKKTSLIAPLYSINAGSSNSVVSSYDILINS